MKRYSQRYETKCNFCFEWFHPISKVKCKLNLCQQCFNKAAYTSYFKAPSTEGHIYQLYFSKKIDFMVEESQFQNTKNSLLKTAEELQDKEIKLIIDKWNKISHLVHQNNSITQFSTQKLSQSLIINSNSLEKMINEIQNKIQLQLQNKKIPLKESNILNLKLNLNFERKNTNNFQVNSHRKENDTKRSFKKDNIMPSQKNMMKNSCIMFENFDSNASTICNFNHLESIGKRMVYETTQKKEKKNNINHYLDEHSNIAPVLHKIMTEKIFDAISNTYRQNGCIELVSYNLDNIDFKCYLLELDWEQIKMIKFIKVNLDDHQFKILLDFLCYTKVECLVVTNNNLTQLSIFQLLSRKINTFLKKIYIAHNQILPIKIKKQLTQLRKHYLLYL